MQYSWVDDVHCAVSCPIRLLVSAIMGQSAAATLGTGVHHGNGSAVITVTCHYTAAQLHRRLIVHRFCWLARSWQF